MQERTRDLKPEHIVILGGGFGGRYAAKGLAFRLPRQHRITLIDRVDYMLYTPMLTEVAGGTIRPIDIAVPAANLPKRVNFMKGEVTAVDAASKLVTLSDGRTLQATQLVFALGATTNYHDILGAREGTIAFKTLADAEAVLQRLDQMVTAAAHSPTSDERRNALTIAVAGGGYTGVETMAAISEHLREKVQAAGLPRDEVKLVLVEPTGRLMQETAPSLAAYSQAELERDGVRVVLNTGVSEIKDGTVRLTDGTSHATGLVIWDTGITPSPLLEKVRVPKGKHHGVVVNACFQVQGMAGVWAIGDCAEIPQANGKSYAPTAQNATREGTHLAQNISAVLRGDAPRPFRYSMIGQLALVSRRRAVAEVFGVKLRGLFAWALWWAIYTFKLPYRRGRVGVVKSLLGDRASSQSEREDNSTRQLGAPAQ